MQPNWHDLYQGPDPKLWFGRVDNSQQPQRYSDIVQFKTLNNIKSVSNFLFALLGNNCDLGVKLNQGRAGAAAGPQSLKKHLAGLPIHKEFAIVDCGDIYCKSELVQSQAALAQAVELLHANKYRPIILGGGHETAWGHYQGLIGHYPDLVIINFDAHFDIRNLVKDKHGSSGTPFFQAYQYAQDKQLDFNYNVIGIQEYANTTELFNKAQQMQVRFAKADEIIYQTNNTHNAIVDDLIALNKPIYVSFCLDVLSAQIALGVSAPQVNGLQLMHVMPMLRKLAASGKVVAFDIVEYAPKYDIADITAKTAAYILSDWLHNYQNG